MRNGDNTSTPFLDYYRGVNKKKKIIQKHKAFPIQDSPTGSDSKESACSAGDLALIPVLGRSLCWEDPLEKRMATHSSILVWRIPWTEELTVHGLTQLSD